MRLVGFKDDLEYGIGINTHMYPVDIDVSVLIDRYPKDDLLDGYYFIKDSINTALEINSQSGTPFCPGKIVLGVLVRDMNLITDKSMHEEVHDSVVVLEALGICDLEIMEFIQAKRTHRLSKDKYRNNLFSEIIRDSAHLSVRERLLRRSTIYELRYGMSRTKTEFMDNVFNTAFERLERYWSSENSHSEHAVTLYSNTKRYMELSRKNESKVLFDALFSRDSFCLEAKRQYPDRIANLEGR